MFNVKKSKALYTKKENKGKEKIGRGSQAREREEVLDQYIV